MRKLLFASSALLALTACYNAETADTAGDGLVDAEETRQGTDMNVADTDGDGLTDKQEVDLGLNPLVGDTDLDLIGDKEEVDGGSNGNDCTSVPEGYWPNCLAKAEVDELEGEGWAVDDIMKDWSGFDQFGTEVSLYQFYGSVILLDFSAGWCGPCNNAAPDQEDLYQEYRDQGFIILHVMVDDNSYDGFVTDENFAEDWADEHGLTFPVVIDTSVRGYSEAYFHLYQEGYMDGIPAFAVLGRDMTFVDTWIGEDESRAVSNIEDLL